MEKVLICDDEQNIREGLKHIIDWKSLGFEIAGEAASGDAALEKIAEINPSLVLLDIRMPKAYGTDVVKKAREAGFTGKFIILSGYSDFSYAQAVIRYGVEGYLTKPIDEEELEKVVKKAADALKEDKKKKSNMLLYREKAKNIILHEIITGGSDELDIGAISQEELNKLGFNAPVYQVVIHEKFGDKEEDPGYDFAELLRVDPKDEYEFDSLIEEGNNVLLLKGEAALNKLTRFIDRHMMEDVMPNSPLDSCFVTFGSPVYSLDEIYISYEEALSLIKKRFFCEKGRHFMGYEELAALKEDRKNSLSEDLLGEYTDKLSGYMLAFNKNRLAETMHTLENLLYNAEVSTGEVKMFMTDLMLRLKSKAAHLYDETNDPFASNSEIMTRIHEANYLYEIIFFITEQIRNFMNKVGSASRETILDDILYYIDNNYSQSLTLEGIAPLFGYTSAYIGQIFSKTMNESFNSYVDRKRIEHSMELLKDDKLKVYEIASRVGYANVDYFHKKFKKHTGISPAQYRKNI